MRAAAIALLFFAQQVTPPTVGQIQTWHEAGQCQRVVDAAQGREEPRVVYLAGLAYLTLEQPDGARQMFQRLAARGDADPWAQVGRSAVFLNFPSPNAEGVVPTEAAAVIQAEQAARRAVELNANLALAHYQLGLVRGRQNDYAGAVSAFDTAITLDPQFAHAHYLAGLSYYRIRQTTQMAISFENFLKLAPSAPEQAQVESIMRTLRGR